MFSSLPSASKIYVSSSKTRSKATTSAKKRRKKIQVDPCHEGIISEDNLESLVSDYKPDIQNISPKHYISNENNITSLNGHETLCTKDKPLVTKRRTRNSSRRCTVSNYSDDISSVQDSIDSSSITTPNENLGTISSTSISDPQVQIVNKSIAEVIEEPDLTLEDESVENNVQLMCLNSIDQNCNVNSLELSAFDSENNVEKYLGHSDNDFTLPSMVADSEEQDGSSENKTMTAYPNDSIKLEVPTENEPVPINNLEENLCLEQKMILPISVDATEPHIKQENELSQKLEPVSLESKEIKVISISTDNSVESERNQVLVNNLPEENVTLSVSEIPNNEIKCYNPIEERPINPFDLENPDSFYEDIINNDASPEDPFITERQPSELSFTESALYESKQSLTTTFSESENIFQNNVSNTSIFISDPSIALKSDSSKSLVAMSGNYLNHKTENLNLLKRCSSFPNVSQILSRNKNNQKPVIKTVTSLDKGTFTSDFEQCENCLNVPLHKKKVDKNVEFNIKLKHKSVSANFDCSPANVLSQLTVTNARARSYVFGSMGPTSSLLGSDELRRFFPSGQVTVFVGTWNMNSEEPPKTLDDFLLPLNIEAVPDIYAIGVQESMLSKFEWEVLLQTTLGASHVLFASSSLGVLHLSIFIRRDLVWFFSEPEDASVATRPVTMVKTKGAVAVSFMFFGTSFLFVNSHLTAHEQKLKERVSDYEKICSSLDLPKSFPLRSSSRDKDVTSKFDCVFWCGDLNFRVIHDRPSVISFVEKKICRSQASCSFLVKHDQLFNAMAEGTVFNGFQEGVINFIPSYKFDVGTNSFDSSTKLRVPSYTDRILYRSKEKSSVICLHYDAVSSILTSDHKPVFAVFKVNLKPGRDNVPLAAGIFNREIYLEAIRRRLRFLEVRQSQGQSTICNLM